MPKITSPIIAGIDPSLGSAAVVVGRIDSEPRELAHTTFAAGPAVERMTDRIVRWLHHSDQIIRYLAEYKPSFVLIEGYSFNSKGRSILDLAEFGGILRNEMIQSGLKLTEISPNSLKQFVCGKGNANKTEVVASLSSKYKIEFKTNDEYDALGLWLIGKALFSSQRAPNEAQRKVLRLIGKVNV